MTLSPTDFALCMSSSRQWVTPRRRSQYTLIINVIAAVLLHACLLWFWPQPIASLPNEFTTEIVIVDAVAAVASQPVREVAPESHKATEQETIPKQATIPEQVAEQQVVITKAKPRVSQQKKTTVMEQPISASMPASVAASIPAAAVSTEPVLVDKPQFVSPPVYPAYPYIAHRRGQQGTVWLEIWLSESGKQLRLSIARSSGFTALDEAAKTAAESWKFLPYQINGMTVASRVKVPVEFVIQ